MTHPTEPVVSTRNYILLLSSRILCIMGEQKRRARLYLDVVWGALYEVLILYIGQFDGRIHIPEGLGGLALLAQ